MKTLNVEQTQEMIEHVCDAIIESKPYLTEVDSKIGDGDHGIGMAGGMQKAKEELRLKKPFTDINGIFKTTGMAMLNSMGGASGVIFGSMFLGGIKGKESITALSSSVLAELMRGSLTAIMQRGKAQVGDKTMVDALAPAVEALEESRGEDLETALEKAVQAAEWGVEETKKYVAKFGRAKSLMERAVGYQDAGATSVSIIFRAMYEYVKGGRQRLN